MARGTASYVVVDDVPVRLTELARKSGVAECTLYRRLRGGWDPVRAATERSSRRPATIEVNGEQVVAAKLADQNGIPRATYAGRIRRGWDPLTAATIPNAPRHGRTIEIDGVRRTVYEWCLVRGVRYGTVMFRIRRGATPEEALSVPVRHYHAWSEQDLAILRGAWGHRSCSEIARMIGVTEIAALHKAIDLGLGGVEDRTWRMSEVASATGWSVEQVRRAARCLRLHVRRVRSPHTEVRSPTGKTARGRRRSFHAALTLEQVDAIVNWLKAQPERTREWIDGVRPCCVSCKTTSAEHSAKGRCEPCYRREARIARAIGSFISGERQKAARSKIGRRSVSRVDTGVCVTTGMENQQ